MSGSFESQGIATQGGVGVLGAGGGGGGGTGNVVGPASATDGAVAKFDGTTGKLLKDGVVLGTLATQNGTFSGTSSGTNTGDQTNITGNAATVTTNANLTGPVTSVGNATTIANDVALPGNPTTTTQVISDSSTKVATTAFVQSLVNTIPAKEACKYASTAALPTVVYANGTAGVGATLTGFSVGAISLDSGSPSVTDRVLIKNQASTFQNGIYTVTAAGSGIAVFVLTRTTDFDQAAEIKTGASVFITAGTTLASTTWDVSSADSPVMGTDAITFAQSAAGSVAISNVTGLGANIATALAVAVGSAGAPQLNNGSGANLTSLAPANFAAGVLGANVTIGESVGQIVFDAALSADGTWSGIQRTGTAGETLAFGDCCYFKAADSRWWLGKADAASTSGEVMLGMCVLAGAAAAATNMLLFGIIRADTKFPTFTISVPVHLSAATGGAVVVAAPTGTDSVTRRLGFADTADSFFFNPSNDYYSHV